jgi:hypothetical protein
VIPFPSPLTASSYHHRFVSSLVSFTLPSPHLALPRCTSPSTPLIPSLATSPELIVDRSNTGVAGQRSITYLTYGPRRRPPPTPPHCSSSAHTCALSLELAAPPLPRQIPHKNLPLPLLPTPNRTMSLTSNPPSTGGQPSSASNAQRTQTLKRSVQAAFDGNQTLILLLLHSLVL